LKELLKKLRKYEIQIGRLSTADAGWIFTPIFKGSGLEFDDVRPYQYGDDIRTIGLEALPAKGHGTFLVKRLSGKKKSRRSFLSLTSSASQNIGKPG